jgi:PAS domain S-box-containing protein
MIRDRLNPWIGAALIAALPLLLLIRARIRSDARTRRERRDARDFRDIMESPYEGLWRFDPQGRTLEVNRRMAEMLGYPAEDLIGRAWPEFVHDRWHEAQETLRRILRGETLRFDCCLRRRDGTPVWALATSHTEKDGHGRVQAVLGLFLDVTEQHRAAEEQVQALSLLEATLDSTADGILVVDSDGKIVRFNERFVGMWRIPP